MLKNFQKIAKFPKHTKIYPGHEYAASNFLFGLFVEPQNEKMLAKSKWCQAQAKENGGICVPSTVEDELNTNVFMRTSVLKEATKEKWNDAAKHVSLSQTQKFELHNFFFLSCVFYLYIHAFFKKKNRGEADIMSALRVLKTSNYHKQKKNTTRQRTSKCQIIQDFSFFFKKKKGRRRKKRRKVCMLGKFFKNFAKNINGQMTQAPKSGKWKVELIENNQVILVTMNSNAGNFLNEESLGDFQAMMKEVGHPSNQSKYGRKPLILVSGKENIFSAGMDLNRVLEANDRKTTKQLFTKFSETMERWVSLPRKTVTVIDGHAIAGGFFIGLGSDVRIGLNKDSIKIGIPFPAIAYFMFNHKLSPEANWELLLQGKLYNPKQMLDKFQYFDCLRDSRAECLQRAIEEALNIKPNCMEAYLSVKQYLCRNLIFDSNFTNLGHMSEFTRVRCSETSMQRMQEVVKEFGSNKKSKDGQSKHKIVFFFSEIIKKSFMFVLTRYKQDSQKK
ncbi:Enoyl-CoA hydratase/isomerase [Reticulomyxa filosa]|uniref:Enoyl-CoA hydratase/isomerase n=1 Tax=Reticulomyxa filosa TaxID=46433 RepID=X6NTV7_RETFI|nr:Enoyl-CoA hydratase/isomerase [Reticulomyxa filosa]|eukprot:ETO28727.1 Enoyl-CoA hydratase/isomerase [Reticulomyxa filosa]